MHDQVIKWSGKENPKSNMQKRNVAIQNVSSLLVSHDQLPEPSHVHYIF